MVSCPRSVESGWGEETHAQKGFEDARELVCMGSVLLPKDARSEEPVIAEGWLCP